MTRSRACFALVLPCLFATVLACKKDPPLPPPVEAPPPAPMPTAPVELAPLVEDAGPDAREDAAPPRKVSGVSANVSRGKQCCNALRAQAKALGPSPEGGQLTAIAAMCDGVAAQLGTGTGSTAPEFEPIRQMLKGKTLPPVCQGL